MDETGWSWDQLMSTPYPVVQIKAAQMAAKNKAMKLKQVLEAVKGKETMNTRQGRR